ncbi:MAG: hypothetical protein GY805_12450 [Chloroflexi bacterium]|nr:hypothetical protein [Chloroflexota bacterium]
MSKTTETAVTIGISEDALHDIVKSLGNALKPQVFYNPDPNQMLEDALKTSQNHVQAALKKLTEILPPTHWMMQDIVDVMLSGEEVWNRYPF